MTPARDRFIVCRDFYPLLLLVAMILWFASEVAWGGKVPFFRDLGPYFYPLRWSLAEGLKTGELPLWDRHMAAGFPLLAAFQSGAFYPPHFLFMFLPFFAALRAIFIFHFLVAGIGAYKLLRHWSYPSYLSISGALLFTLGGTVVSLSNLLNHFQTAVWLPWVILAWERALRFPTWTNFLRFTLFLTIQFLAGSPEIFAMGMALAFLDGLRCRSLASGTTFRRIITVLLGGIALLLALTMAQLLPTAELFTQSRRQHAIPSDEAFNWSLKPVNLLNLFFLDKEVESDAPGGVRFFFARQASFYISYYLGAISVFGICLWLFYGSMRERIIVTLLVAVSLVVTLGGSTPIYPFLFRHLPMLSAIRFPEKFFFFTYTVLFFVTMRGLKDFLLAQEKNVKTPFLIFGSVCLIWLGVYFIFRFNADLIADFISARIGPSPPASVDAKTIASVLANIERQVILSAGMVVLLCLAKTKLIRPLLFSTLLVSTVYVDLTWAHRSFLFPLHPDFVFKSPRILSSAETGGSRLFYYPSTQNLHPSSFSVPGRPSFGNMTALPFQNLLPNAGVLYGVDYLQEIDALGRQPYTDFLVFASRLEFASQIRLLRALNVGYLISINPLAAKGIALVGHFPQYFSWLYKIEGTVPRVYIVGNSSVEKNPEMVLQRLASPGFDATQEVVLDAKLEMKQRRTLVASAKMVRYEHDAATVHASLNDSGILVLADAFYPGWKAYVDGKEAPIFKANHFFRAVVLAPGEHVVVFKYEPLSFKIGLIVSVFTILCIVAISVVVYRKGSNSPSINAVTDRRNP